MCGIGGIISVSDNPKEFLKITLDYQRHRGPDEEAIIIENNIGLCHSRLSIIDIENGKQPMKYREYIIVYNGEIYNYKEIRSFLKSKGYSFNGNSDTEVILIGFAELGKEILPLLRGMFAFCIWNINDNSFFLARDSFGIKPLHYLHHNSLGFAFSSESKPLIKHFKKYLTIDIDAIDTFMTLQYIPAPYTIYKEIKKLDAGSWILVNKNGRKIKNGSFFSITNYTPPKLHFNSFEQAKNHTLQVLNNSVKSHLIADVEVGTFLSGGIDSTLITYLAAKNSSSKINSFSIGFSNTHFDETKYAKIAAEFIGTKHHVEIINNIKPEDVKFISNAYGEPYGDSSAIPTYFVSKLAAKSLKVCLTGDGADELFFGYERFGGWLNKTKRYKDISLIKRNYVKFMRNISKSKYGMMMDEPNFERWLSTIEFFPYSEKIDLWNNHTYKNPILYELSRQFNRNNSDIMNKARLFEIFLYLNNDILTKVDIASMNASLETRPPFVDIEVLNLALQLPHQYLYNKNEFNGKSVLKEIISDLFPDDFVNRPKMGFSLPLDSWLFEKGTLRNYIIDELTDNTSPLYNFFSKKSVLNRIDGLTNTPAGKTGPLWLLIVLHEWLKEN